VGAIGRVVVTFDKSHPKVGVRFDKPVPMGTSLGGACENGHGLICSAAHLEPHAVSGAATVAVVDALEAAIRTLQRRDGGSGDTAPLKPVVVGLSSLTKGKEFAERNRLLAAMAARLPTPVLIVGCYPSATPKDRHSLGSVLFPGAANASRQGGTTALPPIFQSGANRNWSLCRELQRNENMRGEKVGVGLVCRYGALSPRVPRQSWFVQGPVPSGRCARPHGSGPRRRRRWRRCRQLRRGSGRDGRGHTD
jgi:hypothetical protein